MMYQTRRAIAAQQRSPRFQYFLYLAIGNLIAAVLFNPAAPARAYQGIFEMFGDAAKSIQQATSNEPVEQTQADLSAGNPWTAYVPDRVVTEEEWAHFSRLKLPQRRDTMGKVIGPPRQVNYATNPDLGYEEHQLTSGRSVEITYQNATDQRGQAGWVAVGVR
jgi:hypothetical protein